MYRHKQREEESRSGDVSSLCNFIFLFVYFGIRYHIQLFKSAFWLLCSRCSYECTTMVSNIATKKRTRESPPISKHYDDSWGLKLYFSSSIYSHKSDLSAKTSNKSHKAYLFRLFSSESRQQTLWAFTLNANKTKKSNVEIMQTTHKTKPDTTAAPRGSGCHGDTQTWRTHTV